MGDEGSLFYFYISIDLNIFKISHKENPKLAVLGRLSCLLLLQFRLGQVISSAICTLPASLTSRITPPVPSQVKTPLWMIKMNEISIQSLVF